MRLPSRLAYLFAGVSLTVMMFSAGSTSARAVTVHVKAEANNGLGTIRGMVRDEGGSPIADATVAIFRTTTKKLLKQVQSAVDGSFVARIIPGTYAVMAVAQGFNPVTLSDVQVNRSASVEYGFRLERSGSGNTLPEKRVDRNSSKWHIRAAQMQRSIYQDQDGKAPIDENATAETGDATDPAEKPSSRHGQTVIQTFFANSPNGNYTALDFATLVPVSDNAEIVLAGQTGTGRNAPQRLQAGITFRPANDHQITVNGSFGTYGRITSDRGGRSLGQVSLQAVDQWRFRQGVILVLGVDYARLTGLGNDASISPRLGVQYDLNAKTRVRAAFTTQTEDKSWSQALDLEGASVVFDEPVAVDDLVVDRGRPQMNKSNRLEFGVERVLDNHSSVEANIFLDTTFSRGISLSSVPIDSLGDSDTMDFVADQQGRTEGLRVVYSRRLPGPFSFSAGYAYGKGQKLSTKGILNPANVFESGLFQSFFSELAADLKTGTSVKTIFRLSPEATVFAIDPFRGRLAIYDPGLSIYITQALPTLGLPIRAEAVVDARNLLDFQGGLNGDDGGLRILGQGRMLRGGILVRF